ncbi:MAG: calcium/sodium antiporter [Clostridium sp.]
MEIILPIILFILGALIIIKGGDLFVDAAIWMAKVTGIPDIIIGATVVSLATTLPEFFVSTIATVSGSPDIAIGNAIGSIICNTGLILAISMMIMPIKVDKKSFMSKAFLMIASTVLLLLFATNGNINRLEGAVLAGILVYYIIQNKKEAQMSLELSDEVASTVTEDARKVKPDKKEVSKNILMFIVGTLFIIVGANLLVSNAQIIAKYFAVPEAIISLTVVALGTSLPELVTALTSISKKQGGVGVGNIIGANILNIVMIVSTCGIISKDGLLLTARNIEFFGRKFINFHQTILLDIPVALVLMLLVILPITTYGKYTKKNGAMLLSVYVFYIGFLFITL